MLTSFLQQFSLLFLWMHKTVSPGIRMRFPTDHSFAVAGTAACWICMLQPFNYTNEIGPKYCQQKSLVAGRERFFRGVQWRGQEDPSQLYLWGLQSRLPSC